MAKYLWADEKTQITGVCEMKYLYSHVSEETAYVVEDYPWGFRLRTQIRYWIETNDKKNGGQRFCSQTVNPKTGQWRAAKKGTYAPIVLMYLDENEHVQCDKLEGYYRAEKIERFKQDHLENLDGFQKDQLRVLIAQDKIMSKITFTVEAVASSEDWEERQKGQDEMFKKLNRAIACEYAKVSL